MKAAKKIILFDGVCNLCSAAVQYIAERDKKDVFRYAALQSEVGAQLLEERAIATTQVNSIMLIEPGIAYFTQSDAALRIGQEFGGVWRALAVFTWVPKPIRDVVYTIVAKSRYRWFGKKEACMLTTPQLQAKFLY